MSDELGTPSEDDLDDQFKADMARGSNPRAYEESLQRLYSLPVPKPEPKIVDNSGLIETLEGMLATLRGEQIGESIDRVIDGATFFLHGETDIEIRWGDDDAPLWAIGESLIIAGPTGIGKTTLSGQLLEALIGIRSKVLNREVTEAKRVLYLAMDRPSQVRRALRRLFDPEHEAILAEKVKVHKGPLLVDIRKNPILLRDLAKQYDCDVVIVDSLKDLVLDISDPKAGQEANTAFQHCLADGIDVLILHHLRKGENKKPTSVNELVGSMFVASGAGSVICLWGDSGETIIELVHLKPIKEKAGPWKMETDMDTGRSVLLEDFDMLVYLRNRKSYGSTVMEAAKEQSPGPIKAGDRNYKKAERALKKLVNKGMAFTSDQSGRASEGQFGEHRYRWADPLDAMDTHRGHEH